MYGHTTGWGQVAILIGQHQVFEEIVRVWLVGKAFERDDESELVIVDRHNERAVVHCFDLLLLRAEVDPQRRLPDNGVDG